MHSISNIRCAFHATTMNTSIKWKFLRRFREECERDDRKWKARQKRGRKSTLLAAFCDGGSLRILRRKRVWRGAKELLKHLCVMCLFSCVWAFFSAATKAFSVTQRLHKYRRIICICQMTLKCAQHRNIPIRGRRLCLQNDFSQCFHRDTRSECLGRIEIWA